MMAERSHRQLAGIQPLMKPTAGTTESWIDKIKCAEEVHLPHIDTIVA